MKRYITLMVGCAFCAGTAGPLYADCAEDLARMTGETIESPTANATDSASESDSTASDSNDTASQSEGIAKDGSHAPLEDDGNASAVATSKQDVQAQQEGELPAADAAEQATAAEAGNGSVERTALIERARTALAAGDEAACRDALKEADAL